MILFLYNLALLAALAIGSPWWLWRIATTKKYREGLPERLGRVRFQTGQDRRPLIWVHAVSVGEVLAVSRLVEELDLALPDHLIAISTTTQTGQALARERFGSNRVFYCPLDLPWATRAYLNALQPRLLVLAETEFWPNLLSGCYSREIPVAVVNARVSDRSWPRYRRLRWLWRPFLAEISRVLAQSEVDAERLQAIGCLPELVAVAGNLKFDVNAAEPAEATRILKALRLGNRLIVAGSTLEGEEAALLEAWPDLLEADPRLVLVLAPRHPERFDAVAELLDQSHILWKKRSDWREQPAGSIKMLHSGQIVLLDSIGELASVYSLASVAFVGGSLFPAGGHNPLEPAQFGVPIVMGPHFANFRAITEDLQAQHAITITDKGDLAGVLIELLQDRASAVAMGGSRAKWVFQQQSGATERCVNALLELMSAAPIPADRTESQPIQAELIQEEPAQVQSVQATIPQSEPFQFDLLQGPPIEAQLVKSRPFLSVPLHADPVQPDPPQAEPIQPIQIQPDPPQAQPIQAEQIEPEPVETQLAANPAQLERLVPPETEPIQRIEPQPQPEPAQAPLAETRPIQSKPPGPPEAQPIPQIEPEPELIQPLPAPEQVQPPPEKLDEAVAVDLSPSTEPSKPEPGLRNAEELPDAEKSDMEGGGGFNPRIEAAEYTPALAAEGHAPPVLPKPPSLSAARNTPHFSARKLLLPLVPVYGLAQRISTGREQVKRLRFPVVSIGNLSTGGTGKTPMTIALAEALTRCGFQVDVLSRGYGRKSRLPVRVAPTGTAEDFGDEPLLIARHTGVPVYVANKRYDAGLLAEGDAAAIAFLGEELRPVVHLLDDGFQHRQVYRNVDVLLLDRQDWTDSQLPAGNLREPLKAAHRAGVIAVPSDDPELKNELKAWGWGGAVWSLSRKMDFPAPHGRDAGTVAAFCGIARPRQFFAGLEASGLRLSTQTAFPDHHPYTARDVEQVISKAAAAGAIQVLTTEKDSVRLGKLASTFPESLPLRTVGLRVKIEHEDQAIEWLLGRLPLSP